MTDPEALGGCRNCRGALPDLNLLDGRLVGPTTTLRIRSMQGERNQRTVVLTCQNCGTMTLLDADWVQRELDNTRAEQPVIVDEVLARMAREFRRPSAD